MMIFKKINGEQVEVVKHTLDILSKYPSAEVHIGTDSQNHRRHTVYTTVIAYRYGFRGVHYIYSKQRVPKIKDIWTRLWNEAERSIETAEWLTKKINVRVEIDMDYNGDAGYLSNKLISSTKGWANSLGYKVNVKPYNRIATKAADHQCR